MKLFWLLKPPNLWFSNDKTHIPLPRIIKTFTKTFCLHAKKQFRVCLYETRHHKPHSNDRLLNSFQDIVNGFVKIFSNICIRFHSKKFFFYIMSPVAEFQLFSAMLKVSIKCTAGQISVLSFLTILIC